MKIIESVKTQSVIKESGPVTITGNIEDNAQIEIDKGTLLICGNVGNNVKITCSAEQGTTISTSSGVYINAQITCSTLRISTDPDKSGTVSVVGNIGENVNITCDGAFDCKGEYSNNVMLNGKRFLFGQKVTQGQGVQITTRISGNVRIGRSIITTGNVTINNGKITVDGKDIPEFSDTPKSAAQTFN